MIISTSQIVFGVAWMSVEAIQFSTSFFLCTANALCARPTVLRDFLNVKMPSAKLKLHDALPFVGHDIDTGNTTVSRWGGFVGDLLESGVALLELKENSPMHSTASCIPKAAFDSSIQALSLLADVENTASIVQQDLCREIEESADSAHATGYHRAGCMSARYNAYREGFVFSDGHLFDVRGCPSFKSDCAQLQAQLHRVADNVLNMLGHHLELPMGWFQQELGPTQDSSQWHIKRYVHAQEGEKPALSQTSITKPGLEWLPTHTDPSLISIVLLHQPGKQEGSSGLQYNTKDKLYLDVPASGYEVAIVFVGSVLQHLTGGYFHACRHRVVYAGNTHERTAATLFVRPVADTILTLPPSAVLTCSNCKVRGNLTFSQWNAKVARNYERAQHRSRSKQLSTVKK